MSKKKLSGWLSAFSAIAAAIVLSHGGKPAPPAVDHTAEWTATCADVYRVELGREIDPSGLTSCLAMAQAGKDKAGIVAVIDASPEHAEYLDRLAHPPDPPAVVPVLHVDGHIFRDANGDPWRWRGVTAFALLDRFAKGEDIRPFLQAYQGYNVLRVWPYVDWTPEKNGGAQGWDTPSVETIRAFLRETAAAGWFVELTLLTDESPARLEWAKALVPQLAGTPGLFLEAGNEPETHKSINTAALRDVLAASGLPWTTGNYEDATKMAGTYGVFHSPRDPEWPRRIHDAVEYYGGGGPNTPNDPAHRFALIGDEPAKLQDVSGDRVKDWRAYFAGCAILAAGCTFHSETGKFARLPTAEEAQLAAVALDALNAFPADAPQGSYRRPTESSLRTYVVGERWMVRIRPTTKDAPEQGWTALDADGITWRKE